MIHRLLLSAALLTGGLCLADPTPFTADYQTELDGVSAQGKRKLEQLADGQWQLTSTAKVLWWTFSESSLIRVNDGQVLLQRYSLTHPLREKRSVDWVLDRSQGQATERRHQRQLPLPDEPVYDPLSLQLQLQLDACSQEPFAAREYQLLDEKRLKTYRIERLREEALDTPVGTVDTLVFRQQRPGKSKYSLLWLAKDWQCLLVRMEQHDPEDNQHQQLTIDSVKLAGQPLQGRQP